MTLATSALRLTLASPAALAECPAAWWDGVLGLAMCGGERPACVPEEVPVAMVDTPPLDAPPLCEVWSAAAPLHGGRRDGVRYRCDGTLLFGCVELAEDEAGGSRPSALQAATARAYAEAFALIDGLGYPFLWRVWNYVPQINLEAGGSERYWQFNSGRQDAFLAAARTTEGAVPAACALGVRQGPAVLYFLAAREAPLALENPRQLAAYHYPEQYGPRSPTFSRASLVFAGERPVLFVSGTASIVGHETRHRDDVAAQTRETLCNIEAVLGEARRRVPAADFTAAELVYKAYVRYAGDAVAVREIMRERLGPDAMIGLVRADVCRQDLLVEIEASAGHEVEWMR